MSYFISVLPLLIIFLIGGLGFLGFVNGWWNG